MNFRKATVALLATCFGVYVFLLVAVDLTYYVRLPRESNPVTGQVNQVVVSHGSVRYASEHQLRFRALILRMWPIAPSLFFAALVLGLKGGVLHVAPTSKGLDHP